MIEKFVSLIPPFLNAGSKGSAVEWLVRQLHSKGFLGPKDIRMTLGMQQLFGLRRVQKEVFGFQGEDKVDGNFGEESQLEWEKHFGGDIKKIPNLPGQRTWWLGPNHENFKIWPPE